MKEPEKRNKRVTLKEIASRANCSQNTVSLALRNSPRISRQRRLEIHEIASSLGYVANLAAQQLRGCRSDIIGVYSYPFADEVRWTMSERILLALHEGGYRPILGLKVQSERIWHQSSWVQVFRELNADAVVLISQTGSDELPAWTTDTPTLFVGVYPSPRLQCDAVALDRREAAALGINHLLEQGHRDILVAVPPRSPFTDECTRLIAAAGGHFHTVNSMAPEFVTKEYFDSILPMIRSSTAAIFGGSKEAIILMQRILEVGLRIPEDLAMVAYDYCSLADHLAVPLTTIDQPLDLIAERAVETIRYRLTNPDATFVYEALPHNLVVRASSRAPRHA